MVNTTTTTVSSTLKIPLSSFFKNICLERQQYTNSITGINIQFKDTIYILGTCCVEFKRQDNIPGGIKYVCECEQNSIWLPGPFTLCVPTVSPDIEYQRRCREEYIQNDLVHQRTTKIKAELDRLTDFRSKLRTTIAPQLNEKTPKRSHVVNVWDKINGHIQYEQSLFLYALGCDDAKKNNIRDMIRQEFDKPLDSDESLFTYLALYNVLRIINTHIDCLEISLDNIQTDIFNLHPQCMFNDTIEDVLVEDPKLNYNYDPPSPINNSRGTSYVIKDYSIEAITINTIDTKCACNAYVLWKGSRPGSDKWNIFPYHNGIDQLDAMRMKYLEELSTYWKQKEASRATNQAS